MAIGGLEPLQPSPLAAPLYRTALSTLETLHWLCVYMDAKLHALIKQTFAQRKIFLEGTLFLSIELHISAHRQRQKMYSMLKFEATCTHFL